MPYICRVYKNIEKMTGRPKESIESLPEKWYHDILDLYRDGGSDVEVKALIYDWRGSFSNDLWERWMLEEPQFSETIKMGHILAQSWWMKNGRTNLMNKDFNYTGWYMQMKNRYGWADKSDVTSGGEKMQPTTIVFRKYTDE